MKRPLLAAGLDRFLLPEGMSQKLHVLSLCGFLAGCTAATSNPPAPGNVPDTSHTRAVETVSAPSETRSDTLQFVEYDDNGDYAFAVFIDRDGLPETFYRDELIPAGLSGKLFALYWSLDTFYAAGDGDTPYLAQKIDRYEVLPLPAFRPYKTDAQIREAVEKLPIVRALPEKDVFIDQRPDAENPYHIVQVNTPQAEPGSTVTYNMERYRFKVEQIPAFRILLWEEGSWKEY